MLRNISLWLNSNFVGVKTLQTLKNRGQFIHAPITTHLHFLDMLNRLNRVVADSGAGSTIETFRNSELIFAIFKNFALKFTERTSIKVLENKCENKASL